MNIEQQILNLLDTEVHEGDVTINSLAVDKALFLLRAIPDVQFDNAHYWDGGVVLTHSDPDVEVHIWNPDICDAASAILFEEDEVKCFVANASAQMIKQLIQM